MTNPRQNRARKQAISIRLDAHVVAFFKRPGPGYQKRINQVLRLFMDHQRAHRAAKPVAPRASEA